jgi:hypothetical protein
LQSLKQESKHEIIATDEKDISAIKKEENKYSWLQGENVNRKRQARSRSPQGKRQEETHRI